MGYLKSIQGQMNPFYRDSNCLEASLCSTPNFVAGLARQEFKSFSKGDCMRNTKNIQGKGKVRLCDIEKGDNHSDI